jgi:hypothetical protein
MILKNQLFNMNLSIFFKNVNMIFNRLQVNKILKISIFKLMILQNVLICFLFLYTLIINIYLMLSNV